MRGQYFNNVHLNHLGFPQNARKIFVYEGAYCGDTFTVKKMRNGALQEVYTGKLEWADEDYIIGAGSWGKGDFSAVTEEGVYRVYCGDACSRTFYIYNRIYDSACRVMTQYFVWQRCGDESGWNGPCHTQDCLIDKNGKAHSLIGGHHQSGDLRKWAFGVPEGIWGLSEFLQLENPLWNRGDIEYDIAHSAKYFLSRISDEGYVFDSTFLPIDYNEELSKGKGYESYESHWHPFRYYDRPTDHKGHWNTIAMLASASVSLKEYDFELSRKCVEGAYKVWNYMMTKGEKEGDFDWEMNPPLGHDCFKKEIFDFYYPNSAMMLAGRIFAGLALYKAMPNSDIEERLTDALRRLASYFVKEEDGSLSYIKMSDVDSTAVQKFLFTPVNFGLRFACALEILPNHKDAEIWRDCVRSYVLLYRRQTQMNVYGKITNTFYTTDDWKTVRWNFGSWSWVADVAKTALFLSKASAFVDEREECLAIAQRQLDWVIGGNPMDASCIEAVGYNQPSHAVFGEFFPAQPQIPGGVFTDIALNDPDFVDGYGREYDMPVVGMTLYSLAYYQKVMSSEK